MLEFTLLFFCLISYRKIDVIENIVASPTHSSLWIMIKIIFWLRTRISLLIFIKALCSKIQSNVYIYIHLFIYISFICVLNLTSIDKCHGYRTDKDYGRFFLTVLLFFFPTSFPHLSPTNSWTCVVYMIKKLQIALYS